MARTNFTSKTSNVCFLPLISLHLANLLHWNRFTSSLDKVHFISMHLTKNLNSSRQQRWTMQYACFDSILAVQILTPTATQSSHSSSACDLPRSRAPNLDRRPDSHYHGRNEVPQYQRRFPPSYTKRPYYIPHRMGKRHEGMADIHVLRRRSLVSSTQCSHYLFLQMGCRKSECRKLICDMGHYDGALLHMECGSSIVPY